MFNVLGLGIPLTYDHLAQQANYFLKLTTSNFQTLELLILLNPAMSRLTGVILYKISGV